MLLQISLSSCKNDFFLKVDKQIATASNEYILGTRYFQQNALLHKDGHHKMPTEKHERDNNRQDLKLSLSKYWEYPRQVDISSK